MKGYIYCIRSHQTNDVYIGSTIQALSCRMSKHRADYKSWINKTYNYVTSFEILKYADSYIELVEESEYASKQEMQQREGYFIREMECVNKHIAGRTRAEYRADNPEKIKETKAKYYIDNVDKIKETQAKYRADNPEKIKETQSKYYIDNVDKIKETQAKYRADNQKKIKEKHTCPCGGKYIHGGKSHHLETKKHKIYCN